MTEWTDVLETLAPRLPFPTSCIIACVTTGSRLYRMDNESSDKDYAVVVIPPIEYLLGLKKMGTLHVQTDDMDIVVYDVRHFAELCLKQNPSTLEVLHAPSEEWVYNSMEWVYLHGMRSSCISEMCFDTFSGFAKSLIGKSDKLKSTEGMTSKRRIESVEKNGYDTRNAAHILRLLSELEDYVTNKELTFPSPRIDVLRGVKAGDYTYDEWLALYEAQLSFVESLRSQYRMPSRVDAEPFNQLLVRMMSQRMRDESLCRDM